MSAQAVDRTGLYIMVIIILLNSCSAPSTRDVRDIVKEQCGPQHSSAGASRNE